jgi:hypothetical protein
MSSLRLLFPAVSEKRGQGIPKLHPKSDTQGSEDVGKTSSALRRPTHPFEVNVTAYAIQYCTFANHGSFKNLAVEIFVLQTRSRAGTFSAHFAALATHFL